MIPAAFDYRRAASLDDAIRLLGSTAEAKVLAGGQSLVQLMKLRLARPALVVDIGHLPELRGVRRLADGRIAVGALTTYRELMESEAGRYGVLADALPEIADLQVRNRGTVGGAVAHADPVSDVPACLLALDAEFVARGSGGERRIAAADFFLGPFTTALAADEILTEIVLPALRDDAGSAYRSIRQPASGYALAGVAAVVAPTGAGGPVAFCRVAITGVGDRPYRATAVEAALTGSDGSPDAIAAAAAHATDGVAVASDIHADAAYRAHLAAVMTRRALEAAKARSA